MSKSLEVRRILKKIDNACAEITAQKKRMRSEVSGVKSWWKGNAANAFLCKYNEIDSDISALKKRTDELRYNTNRLMKLLEEEERESKLLASKLKR